ncbi:MAG: bifunctional (p)ppGpp synthetase/guanosine-3',5'-bis(diphosphate) 3'-pyrophosphohydrolase [Clostridiales bacterium]|nr:bifunctional (p)ppGpp synthetase/guanosine-3',5'-bis(diphosphate) 3'-pyrophosphohydrolase [Clostridiales bacterium]
MEKKFEESLCFAYEKHKNQKRKGSGLPYMVHIYDVVKILIENGADEKTLTAGALHDTVEDTGTSLIELESLFGTEVADMVNVLSERKSLPYSERKHIQAMRIRKADRKTKMVKCADCLSNLRDTFKECNRPNFWERFNAPKQDIEKHYSETIDAIADLEGMAMYAEVKEVFNKIFISTKGKFCTDCNLMKRLPDPDPNDWFCDDDEKYVCGVTGKVLSEANRPYEKQPTPPDCPILDK